MANYADNRFMNISDYGQGRDCSSRIAAHKEALNNYDEYLKSFNLPGCGDEAYTQDSKSI